MNIFAGNSLWLLVSQSDAVSKLVLLILFIMSVVCWALFIGKLLILCIKEKQFKSINAKAEKAKTIQDLTSIATTHPNTAPGYFIGKVLSFLQAIGFTTLQPIHENQWQLVEKSIDNTIDKMLLHDESYLTILSSSAAVAPLLGLFGTVWGLVHSFIRISETQIADIATIAPGIAEALITTLAGLMVAIPALVMFNYLHTKTRKLEYELFVLADRVLFILHYIRER